MGRMRWQAARWRRRWSRAWQPGGAALKAFVGFFGLLAMPALVLWIGRELFAPGSYYTVGTSLEALAAWIAAGVAIPFALVMAYAARRDVTVWFLFVMPIGFFVAFCGAVAVMTVVNGAFDASAPEERAAEVLSRSSWTKARLRHLVVTSWRPGEREVKVWVEYEIYRRDPARVTVTTRGGALGFEWVESVATR